MTTKISNAAMAAQVESTEKSVISNTQVENKVKKNYAFTAFDSKGNEIELRHANIFYSITKEMAQGIRMGIEAGLLQKYKDPRVTYRSI